MNEIFEKMNLCGIDCSKMRKNNEIQTYSVCLPDEEYSFLHEAAVTVFKGTVYAAWYQNRTRELQGETPVFWSYSKDRGRTFAPKRMLVTDKTAQILYCPPVFGICDGRLHMLINEMYMKPDHIHALDLYVFNEKTMDFEMLWSRPIPFKLNTNVYTLDNGKLMLPGRIAEPDGFPNTPALLISDSEKIDAEWRLVRVAENGDLPDNSKYVHPEVSAIIDKNIITLFCRTDENIIPILYRSEDHGETWSGPIMHDIPVSNSKIYSGTLSNGRNYLIANLCPGRRKLGIWFTYKGSMRFDSGFLIQDGESEQYDESGDQWSYPAAFEDSGNLYVIYSAVLSRTTQSVRGAVLSVIPVDKI